MVDSKILIKVIEYCKYHHKAEQESLPEDEKNVWDKDFVKVADEIKGKTPEEIRVRFNIKNDFTPEEEEEVKRENAWCEERLAPRRKSVCRSRAHPYCCRSRLYVKLT